MKPGPITDPELLGLLREISADPRSRLMKLATQGLDRRVPLHEPQISEGEPFLTRAERHLVSEYRHQVVEWLFEAAKKAYLTIPQESTRVYVEPFAGWGPLRSEAQLDAERDLLLRWAPSEASARSTLEKVDLTVENRELAHVLAVACHRLEPLDSLRNLIGCTCFLLGERARGFDSLKEIVSHRPSRWYRSVAEQNIGFGLTEEGKVEASKPHFRAAHAAEEGRPEPLFGLLSACLLSDDAYGVQLAAAGLSELPSAIALACAREHVAVMVPTLRATGTVPGPRDIRRILALADGLPESAYYVALTYSRAEGVK